MLRCLTWRGLCCVSVNERRNASQKVCCYARSNSRIIVFTHRCRTRRWWLQCEATSWSDLKTFERNCFNRCLFQESLIHEIGLRWTLARLFVIHRRQKKAIFHSSGGISIVNVCMLIMTQFNRPLASLYPYYMWLDNVGIYDGTNVTWWKFLMLLEGFKFARKLVKRKFLAKSIQKIELTPRMRPIYRCFNLHVWWNAAFGVDARGWCLVSFSVAE